MFVLNTPQTLAIDKLISRIKRHQTSDDEDNRLHLYLMEPLSTLWKEIIEQPIDGVNEFSSPLIHCAAILSIDPQSFELSSPSQFSHPMAAIVFAAQILTLRAAFRELGESRESLLTIYKAIHRKFLAPDEPSTVGWVIDSEVNRLVRPRSLRTY